MPVKQRFVIRGGKVMEVPVGERLRGNSHAGEGLQIINDISPYASPIDDHYIGSRSAHREDLKRNGCRILEKGEREHFQKNFENENDARIDSFVDGVVDRVAGDLFA
jgi:hypothetical protein